MGRPGDEVNMQAIECGSLSVLQRPSDIFICTRKDSNANCNAKLYIGDGRQPKYKPSIHVLINLNSGSLLWFTLDKRTNTQLFNVAMSFKIPACNWNTKTCEKSIFPCVILIKDNLLCS